uniref:Uncharacterized protein n=1 Tax=Glossina palpalis gambiensis TaxID=67801 RepID=A0A1B0BNS0_9MUSC
MLAAYSQPCFLIVAIEAFVIVAFVLAFFLKQNLRLVTIRCWLLLLSSSSSSSSLRQESKSRLVSILHYQMVSGNVTENTEKRNHCRCNRSTITCKL